jgi:hypothetical protein
MFSLLLLGVSVYTLVSATSILLLLHSLPSDDPSLRRAFPALLARSLNLRQLLGLTFYLFGFVLSVSLVFESLTPDAGRGSGVRQLLVHFVFAANVFLVLLLLNSVDWFVSCRIRLADQ